MTHRIRALSSSGVTSGEVTIPGSKSYTNRSLIIASLASGPSTLIGPSFSEDSEAMINALRLLGVEIEQNGHESLMVQGRGRNFEAYSGKINVGPAGTTMRFLTSLISGIPGADVLLSGSERMHKRPINSLVDSLRVLGADIKYVGLEGCPPLHIRGTKLNGSSAVEMDGSISSQFFSSILMIAPLVDGELRIKVKGEQISKSYIDMTLSSMESFGVKVRNNDYREYLISSGSNYRNGTYRIEGDASGASYFFGLAAISGSRVRVNNVNPNSAQGDVKFPELLAKMGCSVSNGEGANGPWIEVQGTKNLRGITTDMTLMPDTAQTLAVVAAYASGDTTITGLSTLKVKETDRLAALKTELSSCGICSEITSDSITVHGGDPRGARIKTYEDHRMAMSFAMMASRTSAIEIEEPSVVNKSFPEFWRFYEALGISGTEKEL